MKIARLIVAVVCVFALAGLVGQFTSGTARAQVSRAVPITSPQSAAAVNEAVGSWFGRAVPIDPSTSPFPEVVMEPTLFADGNLIASDSHELTNPHGTAHGNWVKTGPHSVTATFVWLNLSPAVPNGFLGTFKVVMAAVVQGDSMSGTLEATLYPPSQNPVDPTSIGIPVGVFSIVELRRIKTY